MMRGNLSKGFTLVELSIVLVIIGLLVGGILLGRDLIRQSELRRVVTDVQAFKTAVNAFRLKYNGFPGDITDASLIWPACDVTPANCNGNGNGHIESTATPREDFRAWQQLADSGVLPGSYNGLEGTGFAAGVNVPAAPIGRGIYRLIYTENSWTTAQFNHVEFSAISNSGANDRAVVSAPQAQSIDVKMDDGLITTGVVTARNGVGVTTCVDTVPVPNAYNLSSGDVGCWMRFLMEK